LARKKKKKRKTISGTAGDQRSAHEACEPKDEADQAPTDELLEVNLDEELDEADTVERLIAETLAAAAGAPRPEGSAAEPAQGADTLAKEAPAQPDATGAEIDRGSVSSPEVRDRLLSQALAHAEHKEASYRVPFSEARRADRWKALLTAALVVAAATVAAVPPRWITPAPPARLDSNDLAHSLRVALLLQAEQIEAFRVRSQRLPSTLDELPARLPGIRYVRSGTRAYQLIAYEADGNAIVYDATSPTLVFRELVPGWSSRRDAP
jgi:hypothetical protein